MVRVGVGVSVRVRLRVRVGVGVRVRVRAAPRVHRGPLGGRNRVARTAVLGKCDAARVKASQEDGRGDD